MSSSHRPHLSDPPSTSTLRAELRVAVSSLLDRNLSQSSRWAAQLLQALPREITEHSEDEEEEEGPEQHHVHFRTSTPVKSTSNSLLQHPQVANLIAHSPLIGSRREGGGGGGARPRDSVGSVMSIGPASSPAVPLHDQRRSNDGDLDQSMRPSTSSTNLIGDGTARKRKREWIRRDENEQDDYLLGLSFVRNHEMLRAAHCLERCRGSKGRWLRCYSKFLVSQALSLQARQSRF